MNGIIVHVMPVMQEDTLNHYGNDIRNLQLDLSMTKVINLPSHLSHKGYRQESQNKEQYTF